MTLLCFVPLIALGRDSPTNRWRQDLEKCSLSIFTQQHFLISAELAKIFSSPSPGPLLFHVSVEASIPLAGGLEQQDKCHYPLLIQISNLFTVTFPKVCFPQGDQQRMALMFEISKTHKPFERGFVGNSVVKIPSQSPRHRTGP